MSKSNVMPAVGDRVGFVCGPFGDARDNAGTVVGITSDRFYDHIAHVVMDDGTPNQTVIGAYTETGIGAYKLPSLEYTAAYKAVTEAYRKYEIVRDAFRAGNVSDDEFIAARAVYKQAEAALDAAWEAEQEAA